MIIFLLFVFLAGNPGLSQEEELVIEPEIGATLRFGTYLSNKTYTSDFLT